MAKVFPDGWRELVATGAAARELETLARLAIGLDDRYTVYHGVHWTRVERSNFAIVGEIDFAILGPTGKLLLIEQKAGLLGETAGGLTKKYLNQEKSVASQMARIVDARNKDHLMAIIQAILPASGDVLPTKDKVSLPPKNASLVRV